MALQYLSKEEIKTKILNDFRRKVDDFLNDVILLSKDSVIISDYRWLSETLYKWDKIYKLLFKKSKRLELHVPNNKMILPTAPSGRFLTEEEIEKRIRRHAEKRAFYRIRDLHRDSEVYERWEDWLIGEVMLAKEVIEGSLKLDENISSASYPRLQKVWLKDVKKILAYFKWVARGRYVVPSLHDVDYQNACNSVRSMLVDPSRKASLSSFLEVKAYIENRYLTNGRLDEDKPDAKDAIMRKAARIESLLLLKGKSAHELENWLDAKAYMKLYFENIIPAVLEKNDESVLAVLKSFQFTKTPTDKLHVVDAFEVVVAISFLDEILIEEIWGQHENDHDPYSAISSYIDCSGKPSWLNTLIDHGIDAHYNQDKVWLRGLVTKAQQKTFSKDIDSEGDRLEINTLFKESRIVKRLATL
jgi:hypothetical protein